MALLEPNQGDTNQLKLSAAEARREYQRRYYQLHKEKAKEYQRQYNLTHKKKALPGKRGGKKALAPREVIQATFNDADIMESYVGQTEKMVDGIIKRKRQFTH
ncbi:MAG: hypothetical protein WCT27_01905 [Patescibacteria group bacterium]|jgi:hypothetical protein